MILLTIVSPDGLMTETETGLKPFLLAAAMTFLQMTSAASKVNSSRGAFEAAVES